MKQTAYNLQCKLIELYEAFGWDLYDTFDHAYDAFKLIVTDPELVFSKITISDKQREALTNNILKKMHIQPIKIRTTFNLHCYTYEGVEAIKAALLAAKAVTNDDTQKFELIYQMIAAPQYKAEVVTVDKNGGIEKLQQAVEIIQKEIRARGGMFKLVSPPTRIGTRPDDVDNEDIIANLAKKEEEESSGEESNDEGMGNFGSDDDNQLKTAMEDDDENQIVS